MGTGTGGDSASTNKEPNNGYRLRYRLNVDPSQRRGFGEQTRLGPSVSLAALKAVSATGWGFGGLLQLVLWATPY